MKKVLTFVLLACLSLCLLVSCGKTANCAAGSISDGGHALIYQNMDSADVAFGEDCRLIYTYFDGIRLYLQFKIKGGIEGAPEMYLLLNDDQTEYLPEMEATYVEDEVVYIWNIPALNTVKDYMVCLADGSISKAFSAVSKDLEMAEVETYHEEVYLHDYMSASSSSMVRMTPHFETEIKEIYIEDKETREINAGHIIEDADGVLTVIFERPIESGRKYVFHFWNQKTFASILFFP